jgi:hypothetical protein
MASAALRATNTELEGSDWPASFIFILHMGVHRTPQARRNGSTDGRPEPVFTEHQSNPATQHEWRL